MQSNIRFDDNGWLFPDPHANIVHDVSEDDLWMLWSYAEQEDACAESLRREVLERERRLSEGETVLEQDFVIEQMMIQSMGGTVMQYPFGDRMVTFPRKPHLYRGENKEWEKSVPSLRRELDVVDDPREHEMLVAVAHMRKWRFARLLMRVNIVPFWMARLSDVNWDALAQHYGFKTCLLDLTSDFRSALFFATCTYDDGAGVYRPLTQEEIDADERSRYGCIFHAPNWAADAMEPMPFLRWSSKYESCDPYLRNSIQSGFYDDMAFQIGCQPLQRCDRQSGYVYPMRYSRPLQEQGGFEKLRFRQSVELSRRVYEAMDGGRKVFPNEGITELEEVLQQLRSTVTFTDEDLELAYGHDAIDRGVYPSIESLRRDLKGYTLDGGGMVTFVEEPAELVPQEALDRVNACYDKVDIVKAVGGCVHMKPDDRRYFEQRSAELFGEVV